MTTATATKSRTVRLTADRRALVIRQHENDREQVEVYFLAEIDADQGGRAYELSKSDVVTRYTVEVGGDHDRCSCPGHRRHGYRTVCKHVASLKKLIALGKL